MLTQVSLPFVPPLDYQPLLASELCLRLLVSGSLYYRDSLVTLFRVVDNPQKMLLLQECSFVELQWAQGVLELIDAKISNLPHAVLGALAQEPSLNSLNYVCFNASHRLDLGILKCIPCKTLRLTGFHAVALIQLGVDRKVECLVLEGCVCTRGHLELQNLNKTRPRLELLDCELKFDDPAWLGTYWHTVKIVRCSTPLYERINRMFYF
jgi:hypothetical protein